MATVSLKDDINFLREIYARDFVRFAHDCLLIRTKTKGIKPFILNSVQRDFVEKFMLKMKTERRARFIVLKARQMGLSTLIEALMYWWAIFHIGFKGLVLTHLETATEELFEMTRRYHENIPQPFRPKTLASSAKTLSFAGLESAIKTATAGSKNVAHGSTLQGLHWSEVSRSANQSDMVAGVLQTVPDGDGTMVILESTANGRGEYFHQTWEKAVRGENEYTPMFYPWFEMREYCADPTGIIFSIDELKYKEIHGITDAQLAWRHKKIKSFEGSEARRLATFREQYPATPSEAFDTSDDSLITANKVLDARSDARRDSVKAMGAIVIGVDVAYKGKDSTVFAIRQGQKLHKVIRKLHYDHVQTSDLLAQLVEEWKADGVFIDANGVGSGVVSIMQHNGYGSVCHGVYAQQQATDSNLYVNKRTEMWARMDEWLDNAAIPDSELLQSDLTMLGYGYDGSRRLKLESKQGLSRSPDIADAISFTFAMPVAPKKTKQDDDYDGFKPRITNGGSAISARV